MKVILVTSGQPSLNPRLVKEADALTAAGHSVTVLYAYWNDWATEFDEELLSRKRWQAIRVAGHPVHNRAVYFLSRLINKVAKKAGLNLFPEWVVARSSFFLMREVKRHKADLYIAHNLGALPAAVIAARKYKSPCGFDAEDFHRQEVSDDVNSAHYKLTRYTEDKYLPLVSYITASGRLTADKYAALYQRKVTSILNVFPKTTVAKVINNANQPLRLFWFSQTIGPGRGLEVIIEAMGLANARCELHLLGNVSAAYQKSLLDVSGEAGISKEAICFYPPVKSEEIFAIAPQFDIGLASETGFCLNNQMALSNKLFTYIQSGLAVLASNTPAQHDFLSQYADIGKIYNNTNELSILLDNYDKDRKLLFETKVAAYETGQRELNWESEGKKFMAVVTDTINGFEQ